MGVQTVLLRQTDEALTHCISLRISFLIFSLSIRGFHVCQFRIGHFLEVADFRHLFFRELLGGDWSNINCVSWQVLQGEQCEVSTAKLAGAVASEQRATLILRIDCRFDIANRRIQISV
jgi:hypothetical protein